LGSRGGADAHTTGRHLETDCTGFNVDLIGFDSDHLATILAGSGSSGLTDPDSVPEVPDKPVTWRGDIWLLEKTGPIAATAPAPLFQAGIVRRRRGSQRILRIPGEVARRSEMISPATGMMSPG
jgi:hypothetical protein